MEEQRAGRAGLQIDRRGWIREALEEKLAREQTERVEPDPAPAADAPKAVPQAPAGPPAPKSPWPDPDEVQDQDEIQDRDQDQALDKGQVEDADPIPVGSKTRGGYVHPRTRRHMFAEGAQLGIPAAVLKHYTLLKDGIKPTTRGFLATEDLLSKVKAAKSAGQDPSPLWFAYLHKPVL